MRIATEPALTSPRPDRKIFGIGAHRTATRSLGLALGILGYRCSHWDEHDLIMDDVKAGNFSLRIMEEFDAAADFPIPSIYPQLDKAFPGSVFVLTIRPPRPWLESVARHIGDRKLAEAEQLFYGGDRFDPHLFLTRYAEHNESVERYFAGRDDLLVMDITAGQGWELLAPFLGAPVPRHPFPHVGRKKMFTPIERLTGAERHA